MLTAGAVWGIDIADSGLKAVKLRRVAKSLVVVDHDILRYAELGAETGASKDELIFRALGTFLTRHEVRRDRVYVGIPSQNVFSRFIGLPPVERRRLAQLVEFEARQQIPFDLNEVIWDYQTVNTEFVLGEEIEIGLFAVRREVIDNFLLQLSMLRSRLHGVQIAPLALYNFIRRDYPLEKPLVVIDIGAQSTDLIIVDGSKFWLRNLPIAGNNFTNVIQRRFNVSAEEAESIKRRFGQTKQRGKIVEAIRPVLRDLVAEIQRSVGYYKSLAREVRFEEVVVLGEGFNLYGLPAYLNEHLQYNVRQLSEIHGLGYAGPDEAAFLPEVPSLGVALGLAVQGLGESHVTVNLLPEPFIIDREISAKRPIALVAVLLLWLGVGALYLREAKSLSKLEQIAGEGEKTVQICENNQKQYEAAKRRANTARLGDLVRLTQGREYWPVVLGELTRAVPYAVLMENLEVRGVGGMQQQSAVARASGEAPPEGEPTSPGADVSEGARGPAAGMFGIHFLFGVSTEDKNGVAELTVRLKERLEKAAVYPERVPLFKKVVIGAPRFGGATTSEHAERGSDRETTARTTPQNMLIKAQVACEPNTWEELDRLRKEARQRIHEKKSAAKGEPKGPPVSATGT